MFHDQLQKFGRLTFMSFCDWSRLLLSFVLLHFVFTMWLFIPHVHELRGRVKFAYLNLQFDLIIVYFMPPLIIFSLFEVSYYLILPKTKAQSYNCILLQNRVLVFWSPNLIVYRLTKGGSIIHVKLMVRCNISDQHFTNNNVLKVGKRCK